MAYGRNFPEAPFEQLDEQYHANEITIGELRIKLSSIGLSLEDIQNYIDGLASSDEEIVLDALEQAQAIMTEWLIPDGVSAQKTLERLLPVLDNVTLVQAMKKAHINTAH